MKEADLFRQYAKEAMRWSSSKSASALERRALVERFQNSNHTGCSKLPQFVGRKRQRAIERFQGIGRLVNLGCRYAKQP